ncbi:hypothetical protein EEB18_002180 [Sphingopyxis sp. OPL5]|uniref:hypothetical protein n=1 Tax=Sphingopyxis sp. OPL5 TaxID=2486273 RepID=UPI0008BCD4DA|nr:hypothetical protein [Sphingopyxis sp. OPL5]MBN8846148.1 hypothetical protein [Sphingomonadales bacterium]OHC99966.1 MAG: hypothetical protein A2885_14735 [Sphingopyxis sp. RIFCSPHIGHO2_01_FULL_65_24]QNO27811.1 hypothetical protein EEB18_002180 [Sphingopyxis sp. OPL5]
MERELRRIECRSDGGEVVTVVELQFFDIQKTAAGDREYPGARRFALMGGGGVRLIDARTYEDIETGAWLHLVGSGPDRTF